jgi:tetratricopeptide (TPR) repeat protein
MNRGVIMFKKESQSKQSFVLPVALIAILLSQPALSARNNRKQSTHGSAPQSAGSSSRESSQRPSAPPNPNISYRQAPGPRINVPQSSNSFVNRDRASRQSSSINIPSGRSSRDPLRNSTNSLVPRSFPDSSVLRSQALSNRAPRQSSNILSDPATISDVGRINRKLSTYDYPIPHSRYYSYHHDYYPYGRIFYWVTWPDCYYPIYYTWGPWYDVGYFWPYYHRRYVFVSLGGYWPDYNCMRYYWYGYQPYTWYGYYPPDNIVSGNTYNYYYYNNRPPADANSEVRQKLSEKPPAQPEQESPADRSFDQAVQAFTSGDYNSAANKFYEAQVLAPNDIVLPYAYVQALFAEGQYKLAGRVLRGALMKQSPDKEGVFYPRGLYSDQNVLQQQIDKLNRMVILNEPDADSQLLLGYQLLGTGKYDEAAQHLQTAAKDSNNKEAATLLLDLLEKLKQADKQDIQEPDKTQSENTQTAVPDDNQPVRQEKPETNQTQSGVIRTQTGAVKLPFD